MLVARAGDEISGLFPGVDEEHRVKLHVHGRGSVAEPHESQDLLATRKNGIHHGLAIHFACVGKRDAALVCGRRLAESEFG